MLHHLCRNVDVPKIFSAVLKVALEVGWWWDSTKDSWARLHSRRRICFTCGRENNDMRFPPGASPAESVLSAEGICFLGRNGVDSHMRKPDEDKSPNQTLWQGSLVQGM